MRLSLDKRPVSGPEGAAAPVEGPERLNLMVSRVLAAGLAVSITLLVTGVIMALAGRGPSVASKTSITDIP